MRSRRTVILIVAIVVGAIASFGLLNYIRNVEGSVYDNAEPEIVWVVRLPIPKGTPAEQVLSQNMIVESEIPASFRPGTAVVDPTTELAGLVAVADLPPNAPLVTGNFVAPDVVNTGIVDRLDDKEMVTVTFNVDQVKGAAFLIEPGDFVNVLAVSANSEVEEGAGTGGGSDDPGAAAAPTVVQLDSPYLYGARYVYQRAEVLAIGTALTPELGESEEEAAVPNTGGLITLAVPPDAVQTILNVGLENLYLSLVPPSYEPTPWPALDLDVDLLPGEDDQQLTPYGPPAGGTGDPE